jgi:hypothetical protein
MKGFIKNQKQTKIIKLYIEIRKQDHKKKLNLKNRNMKRHSEKIGLQRESEVRWFGLRIQKM